MKKPVFSKQLNSPPGRVFVYPLAHWWKLPMGFPAGVNCFQNGFPLNRIEDNFKVTPLRTGKKDYHNIFLIPHLKLLCKFKTEFN